MADANASLRCQLGCWVTATVAGFIAAVIMIVVGDVSIPGSIFVGVILAAGLGVILSWLLCRPLPTLEEVKARGGVETNPISSAASSSSTAAAVSGGGVPASGASGIGGAASSGDGGSDASVGGAVAADGNGGGNATGVGKVAGAGTGAASSAASAAANSDTGAPETGGSTSAESGSGGAGSSGKSGSSTKSDSTSGGTASASDDRSAGGASGASASGSSAVAEDEADTLTGDAAEDFDGDGKLEGTNEGTKPPTLTAARGGKADNLKEIKGVGPKLEKMLNGMGIFHFDQVEKWGKQELAWVDANLVGFKGRASRDDWVGQAKILAAGGDTEFSKRVDEGGVY